jgi:hypothetical protein
MVVDIDQRPSIPNAVPKASTEPLPEIVEFLETFAPLFRRSQSRHSLEHYVTGLFTDLDRKNCDTIAAALAVVDLPASGGDVHDHELAVMGSLHLGTVLRARRSRARAG